MARRIEYFIECDGDPASLSGCLADPPPLGRIVLHPTTAEVEMGTAKDRAKEAGRRRGWLMLTDRDYCPACTASIRDRVRHARAPLSPRRLARNA